MIKMECACRRELHTNKRPVQLISGGVSVILSPESVCSQPVCAQSAVSPTVGSKQFLGSKQFARRKERGHLCYLVRRVVLASKDATRNGQQAQCDGRAFLARKRGKLEEHSEVGFRQTADGLVEIVHAVAKSWSDNMDDMVPPATLPLVRVILGVALLLDGILDLAWERVGVQ